MLGRTSPSALYSRVWLPSQNKDGVRQLISLLVLMKFHVVGLILITPA